MDRFFFVPKIILVTINLSVFIILTLYGYWISKLETKFRSVTTHTQRTSLLFLIYDVEIVLFSVTDQNIKKMSINNNSSLFFYRVSSSIQYEMMSMIIRETKQKKNWMKP